MKKIIFVIFLASFSSYYPQNLSFLPKGLGLELGLGHSQMKHQLTTHFEYYEGPTSTWRNKLKITPAVRFSFRKELINNFSIVPFISYSIMGGKSYKKADGYEDEYIFKTLDVGLFTSYSLSFISLSFGGKYNRFLDRTGRFFSWPDPHVETPGWNEKDVSEFIKEWSFDIGGRTAVSLNHFTLAFEAWFSTTDLGKGVFEENVDISTNRFQFLIGYSL